MSDLTHYLAEEIAELFGYGGEVDSGKYDFLPEFIENLITQYKQDNPMTDVINDVEVVSVSRKAAKMVLDDFRGRKGIGNAIEEVDEEIMEELEQTVAGIFEGSLGEGPFTPDVAANLNHIHALAVENDAGYSVAYQPTVKEFTVQSLGQKLEHHVSTTDSLYAAVQQARAKLENQ